VRLDVSRAALRADDTGLYADGGRAAADAVRLRPGARFSTCGSSGRPASHWPADRCWDGDFRLLVLADRVHRDQFGILDGCLVDRHLAHWPWPGVPGADGRLAEGAAARADRARIGCHQLRAPAGWRIRRQSAVRVSRAPYHFSLGRTDGDPNER